MSKTLADEPSYKLSQDAIQNKIKDIEKTQQKLLAARFPTPDIVKIKVQQSVYLLFRNIWKN